MPLLKLTIHAAPAEAQRLEAALAGLEHPEASAVTIFEAGPASACVEAYFEEPVLLADLQPLLVGIQLVGEPQLAAVPETNWVRHVEGMLKPVTAGRFVVHGPHDRATVAPSAFNIEIEAGEAFGTAHHGSTRGCLLAIDEIAQTLDPQSALDIGTGSGVLAIALAKLIGRAGIIATDIDPKAVAIAAENAGKNGVAGHIAVVEADGLGHARLAGPFDLIMANILAEPLIGLAPGIARALPPRGRIILSGLLAEQAPSVITAYRAAHCRLVTSIECDGWSTLILRHA